MRRAYTELMARALGELGVRRAFVVHGADGLDEISISGETYVAELRDGIVRSFTVTPEDFGLRRAPLEAIRGGDARAKRRDHSQGPRPLDALSRARPAPRNRARQCGAALVAAGRAADFLEGVRLARNRSIPAPPARNSKPSSPSRKLTKSHSHTAS